MFINNKLASLGRWLCENNYLNEHFEVRFLKEAASKEEAEEVLRGSKRIPKLIKGLLWEYKLAYNDRDLKYLSGLYRDHVLEYVPNDIKDEDKALAIKWLTYIGTNDKAFASKVLYDAVQGDYDEIMQENFNKNGPMGEAFLAKLSEDNNLEYTTSTIKNKLERFFLRKRFMNTKDIMSIKSFSDLILVIEEASGRIEEHEDQLSWQDAEKGTTFMQSSDPQMSKAWEVIHLSNKGAARYWGKQTEWCTAADGCAFKDYYSEEDPIFVIQHKNDSKERFQVHYGTVQFKDTKDEEVPQEDASALVSILDSFGANKYLASQAYKEYLRFKDRDYTEEEFFEIVSKMQSFMEDVTLQKINSNGQMGQGEWSLDNKFLEEMIDQIEDGLIIEDDSEASDRAAAMIADYRPMAFFSLSLDADYPELVPSILLKSFEPNDKYAKLARDTGHHLKIYHLLKDGSLFHTSSLTDLLDSSEDLRRKLAESVMTYNARDLLMSKKPIHPRGEQLITEFFPNYKETLANDLRIESDNPTYYVIGDDKNPIAVYSLILAEFHIQFPSRFKDILEEVIASYEQKLPTSHWGIGAILDAMIDKKIVNRYFGYYLELLKVGLKLDYDKYSIYAANGRENGLTPEMLEEVAKTKETEEKAYVDNLLSSPDRIFPGWRSGGLSEDELFDLFTFVQAPHSYRGPNRNTYESMQALYNKLVRSLQTKISNTSQRSGGGRSKLELSEDLLLYIATFFPALWSTYNLGFKAVVSSEIAAIAEKSMQKLEDGMRKNRGERRHNPEGGEESEDDDWNEEEY